MMVVPVPCRFCELLKFDTRMSPALIPRPGSMFFGTMTTPYGLTSPFDGTVDTVDGKRGKMLCAGAMAAVRRAMAAMEDDRDTKRFIVFLLIQVMES